MRPITLAIFIFSLLCKTVCAQQHTNSDEIKDLETILEYAGTDKQVSIRLTAVNQALEINGYQIPLAKTTLVRCEKEQGKYQVKFFLQNGTAVTKTGDSTFRRAYWAIDLDDKKACEQFISIFKKLMAAPKS